MRSERLFEDFALMSRSEWLDRVKKDPRSASLMEKLTWKAGDISIPAYATAEDLDGPSSQATVQWEYPDNWRIAEPLDQKATPAAYKQALDAGADALWIESETAIADFSPDNLPAHCFHFTGTAFNGKQGLDVLDSLSQEPGSMSILTEATNSASPALLQRLAQRGKGRFIVIRLAGRPNDQTTNTHDLADALRSFHHYAGGFKTLGLPLTALLNTVQFVFPLSTSFYLEMGRIRALRLLLSKLVMELDPDYRGKIAIPFVADTGLTVDEAEDDPHNNILRGTTMGMSAILSGCSMLIVRPFSDTDVGRRMARNTQLVLKHESRVHEANDPGAGSYYIDNITRQLAHAAWEQFSTDQAE